MIGDSQVSNRRRKVREKKPQQKWSLLYTIPVNILNKTETLGGFNKKGKRFGFSIYDSLVCKKCKPNKFFHTRFSFKTHGWEEHSSRAQFKVISRERKRKINIECIDLDDNDSDDEPAEISIIGDDEDDEVCELIETVRITPDSETEIECLDVDIDNEVLGKFEVSSIENNRSYQPKVFLKDICKEMSRDKTKKTMNDEVVTIEEITLEDDDDVMEERGSPHIRNLLKEFEVSHSHGKENKRKENFEDSSPKKVCLDELLLAEEILAQDILEVTIEESEEVIDVEDDSIVIVCDNFPSKEIRNEDDSEGDISVVVLV